MLHPNDIPCDFCGGRGCLACAERRDELDRQLRAVVARLRDPRYPCLQLGRHRDGWVLLFPDPDDYDKLHAPPPPPPHPAEAVHQWVPVPGEPDRQACALPGCPITRRFHPDSTGEIFHRSRFGRWLQIYPVVAGLDSLLNAPPPKAAK